jgi:transposase-like protein
MHTGKPKWMCKDCRRQFVHDPQHRVISAETKALIDRLLLERISLAGMARVTGVSPRWLQNYVNDTYENVPRMIQSTPKKKDASR